MNTSIERREKSHKGENGKVLVVGGSEEYVGSVFLVGKAAFRAGADWVTIASPSRIAWVLNTLSPDFVTIKLSGKHFSKKHAKTVIALAKKHDVVVIGNGIGQKSKDFIRAVIKIQNLKVIDADAITSIRIQDVSNSILTPHKKEFEILLKNSRLTEKSFQKHLSNNIILLKGRIDKIISKNKIYLNKTGHPGMTVAGTGDVLAGLTAGILSQKKDLLQSARLSAFVSGKIGELLSQKHGYGYTASDMLDKIGGMLSGKSPA